MRKALFLVVCGPRLRKWPTIALIIMITLLVIFNLLNKSTEQLGQSQWVAIAKKGQMNSVRPLWEQWDLGSNILDRLSDNFSESKKRPNKFPGLSLSNNTSDQLWANSPRLTLLVRMYYDSVSEYWQIFAPSYLLFWPKDKWKNSDLVLVFDDENVLDHQASTILLLLPPYPKIVFEKAPPPGTLCSNWRSEGYARQIYSTFYAELHTDAPFIGIADTDSFFSTKVVIEDLFENGKPRILGYNGCCFGWEQAASTIVNGQKFGEFMTVLGFPFIVKREHFKLFREHVMAVYKQRTFEECFHTICTHFSKYSQYDFLAYYLFTHHRDDYSWHILDHFEASHPGLSKGRMTNDPDVLAKSTGKMGVMKHAGHSQHGDFPFIIFDYVCTTANFSPNVGSCNGVPFRYREAIRKSVEYNRLTDWLVPTAYWIERKLPTSSMFFLVGESAGLPKNSRTVLNEHYELVKLYNSSWHW